MRVVRRLTLAVVVVGVVVAAAVGAIIYREITASLPAIDSVVDYQPPVATQILADDGTLIGEFFSEKRYLVPIERIPEVVRQAFIAAEDDGFYRHKGVDFISMVRALINNLLAGGKVQGGSTITQQVVKSVLLTPTKSYERKLKEIILAVRLEKELSKDQILGLYLNHIYLGSGAYGVAAAAREYFGKDIEDVGLAEAALLAGLPQAPSRYSPFQHWPQTKARQRYVLTRMYESGYITREQRDAALRQPLALATRKGSFRAAPYFVEHIRRELEERFGYSALYEMGLRVHTTVNLTLQRAAEEALRAGLEDLTQREGGYRSSFRNLEPEERDAFLHEQQRMLQGETLEPLRSYDALVTSVRGNSARVQVGPFVGDLVPDPASGELPPLQLNDYVRVRWVDGNGSGQHFVLDNTPPIEGALVALDPRTGFVRAMVGGYDFDRSNFNRVTQARRQPGSAFKPLVYAAAFDRHFTTASVVVDEPIFFNDNGKVWSPKNFENKYFGPTTVRDALTFSRNVVTVKVANAIGVKYLVRYLKRFGLQGPLVPNLSIALGSAELTPLELATAYTAFANGGSRPEPIFITRITDQQGQVLEATEPKVVEAIPPQTAYMITGVLQDVITRGTGKRADGLGRPTAGKTGTTNDQNDAWFVGYVPQMLAAVWVGFDAKRSIGKKETGGRVAAPIWKKFMETATQGLPIERFEVPEGLTCVNINPGTGQRAVPGSGARLECFRRGAEPRVIAEPPIQMISEQEGAPRDAEAQPAVTDQPKDPSARDFLINDF